MAVSGTLMLTGSYADLVAILVIKYLGLISLNLHACTENSKLRIY